MLWYNRYSMGVLLLLQSCSAPSVTINAKEIYLQGENTQKLEITCKQEQRTGIFGLALETLGLVEAILD